MESLLLGCSSVSCTFYCTTAFFYDAVVICDLCFFTRLLDSWLSNMTDYQGLHVKIIRIRGLSQTFTSVPMRYRNSGRQVNPSALDLSPYLALLSSVLLLCMLKLSFRGERSYSTLASCQRQKSPTWEDSLSYSRDKERTFFYVCFLCN